MTRKVIDLAGARGGRASSAAVDSVDQGTTARPAPASSGSTAAEGAPRQERSDPAVEGAAATAGAPAVVRSAREAWLEERRRGLGASECAAVLGFDPYRDALAVYCEKVGVTEGAPDTELTRWGRRVQGAIGEAYAEETGRPVVDLGDHVIQRHPDLPWLGATLDFMTAGTEASPGPPGLRFPAGRVPLEVKAVNLFKADEWREDPPLHYQIQLQMQLACTGAAWGSLCALLAGLRIAWVDLLRNENFLAAALPKLEEFWLRVQRREPPAPGPRSHDAVRALWPADNGQAIALPEDTLTLVEQWEQAKAAKRDTEKAVDAVENEIRARMGDAMVGLLADGTSLTLKTQERAGYFVKPAKYRVLRRFVPQLQKGRK